MPLLFFEKIKNHYSTIEQFIKFSCIGALNTLTDFGIYTLLTRVFSWYFLWANIISFTIAASSNFILNAKWTFKNKEKDFNRAYFKFLFISFIGLLGNAGILYALVHFFSVYDLLAKAIATIVILFWNFSANKFWTFRD